VHEQLDMLTSSAVSLLTIINDILDFSKLEAGKFDFDVLPFNLSQVANAVITLLRTRAEEQGISLETEIDPALPAWLVGDSGRLRQILLNLIGNAVKFTATGGVLVAAHAIPAPAGAVGIEFAITDTGIGIDDEAQKNLFGSFAQADSSISRRYGGSGLGLAISKRLVEGQGGTIGVESEPGKGSRFWFRIFYAAGAAPADAGAAAAIVQLPPLRILLAEDNPVNQKVALGLLAKGSHLITIANNGREAVEAAAAGTFDVVLMDVQMPIMDGLTAAREIRRLPGAAGAVPIIALTANAMREDAERCSAAGMNACVTKPIDPATLFERLGHVLASNTCPGQSANGGDNDIVEQISSHLGAEAMAELVEIFLSAGADDLQHLLLLAESGSLAEIRHYAHDLKGMAGYVGADTLGKLMAAVEKAAINGDAATSRALLAGLPLAWEAAVAQLAAAPPQVT
jgi:CheY-like chemotaxis protein